MSADLSGCCPSIAERCLDALALFGGEASTAEIRGHLGSTGMAPSRNYLSLVLNKLARRDPPPVAPLSAGRIRMWRLVREGPRSVHPGDLLSWPQSRVTGRNVRRLREAAGLRQKDLGVLPQATLSMYERGTVRFTVGQVQALAGALGTTAEALTAEGGGA